MMRRLPWIVAFCAVGFAAAPRGSAALAVGGENGQLVRLVVEDDFHG